MTYDLLIALMGYAFATSITPGPNNFMLMASGTNYGVRRTVPHALGVALGFAVLAVCVGLGLVQVFDRAPWTYTVLTVVSVAYMLYLAWRIATAVPKQASEPDIATVATGPSLATTAQSSVLVARPIATGRPMTFTEACLFQWVNPKAIAMAVTTVTVYAPDRDLTGMLSAVAIFSTVNLPCVGLWVLIGVQLRQFLADPSRLRAFNITMAVLLVASLIPILL